MTAGVTLSENADNNPLVTFADKVSVNDGESADMGIASTPAPESLGELRPLSDMAYEQSQPDEGSTGDESGTTTTNGGGGGGGFGLVPSTTTSDDTTPALADKTGGHGPSGLSTSGVDDLGEVPTSNYGNPNGGNYVTDDATTGETIVKVAKAMLGKPYIWGGEDWSGADCSGLVQLAYKQAGIDMPRLSNYQMNKGKQVDYKDLKPGDLIGWNNSNHVVGADHIAIYIGDNKYIEAPRPGVSIRVSDLMSYGTDMMWAVRIPSNKPIPAQKPKAPAKPTARDTPSAHAIEGAAPAKKTPKAAPKPIRSLTKN